MDVDLADLVERWRGRTATLEIDIIGAAEGQTERVVREGILDGPYVGDGPGIAFMLGARIIEGDIAVDGPMLSLEPASPPAPPIISANYIELRVRGLPIVARVNGEEASWDSTLADDRVARCRLRAGAQNYRRDPHHACWSRGVKGYASWPLRRERRGGVLLDRVAREAVSRARGVPTC
jgi:hypothetical protein